MGASSESSQRVPGLEREAVGFSYPVHEEGHKPSLRGLWARRRAAWSPPPAPRTGRTRNGPGSQCHWLCSGQEVRGLRQTDLEARETPGGSLVIPGKAISPERFSPREEGERWCPRVPLSSTETKTRLNISAKRIYKNVSKWTSR